MIKLIILTVNSLLYIFYTFHGINEFKTIYEDLN